MLLVDRRGKVKGRFSARSSNNVDYIREILLLSYIHKSLQNHSKLCSFFSFLQLLLSLSELCQVESCNLFSLLYLLLVGFDFSLELCSEFRHTVLVLPIFPLGKSELFALALSPLESLSCFTSARLSRCKLSLKLTNLSLHLSHC